MIPCDTLRVNLIIIVQSIEAWPGTVIVPPCTSMCQSTVTTGPVIVSVMSGELHAIKVTSASSCQAVTCCPYPPVLVPSNSEIVVGACSAHMKMVITGKFGMSCKVSKFNSQLSFLWPFSQTANLLPSVEVLWPVASSLEHGPAPSVLHVTPDIGVVNGEQWSYTSCARITCLYVCILYIHLYTHTYTFGQSIPLMSIKHVLDWVHSVLVNKLKVALHGS